MDQEVELWLVRHGQTDWNLEGRYQGQADIPLNQRGIDQAKELSQMLKNIQFSAIYCSDLKRAKMTAEIIGKELGLPILIDSKLREIDQGAWQGQLVKEIKERFLENTDTSSNAANLRPPGGETVMEVAKRMADGADTICKDYPHQRVLVVSHGLAVATLICLAGGFSLDEAYKRIPENVQAEKIMWKPDLKYSTNNGR